MVAVLQGRRGGAVAGIVLTSGRHGYGSLVNGMEAEGWRGLWRLGKGEGEEARPAGVLISVELGF